MPLGDNAMVANQTPSKYDFSPACAVTEPKRRSKVLCCMRADRALVRLNTIANNFHGGLHCMQTAALSCHVDAGEYLLALCA
jgi:hypothetical protein